MRPSELSLRVSLRKQPCVLDPTLVLAHPCGPDLALRLTQVLEPWLTRSFWQIIDSSELLGSEPAGAAAPDAQIRPHPVALAAWISLRDNTDAGSWPLRWIGDNVPESQIGEAAVMDIVERYERLGRALEERAEPRLQRCHRWQPSMDPIQVALDAVTLSATLEGALVLSSVTPDREGIPWPVQALTVAGMNATRLDSGESLFCTERQWLRDALVTAGLAVMSQSLPQLAVVHVLADCGPYAPSDGVIDTTPPDPWASARAWWYLV